MSGSAERRTLPLPTGAMGPFPAAGQGLGSLKGNRRLLCSSVALSLIASSTAFGVSSSRVRMSYLISPHSRFSSPRYFTWVHALKANRMRIPTANATNAMPQIVPMVPIIAERSAASFGVSSVSPSQPPGAGKVTSGFSPGRFIGAFRFPSWPRGVRTRCPRDSQRFAKQPEALSFRTLAFRALQHCLGVCSYEGILIAAVTANPLSQAGQSAV